MKYRTRTQYTEADKAMMWERWRRGESLNAIARLFDRNHSAIGGILSRTGGIRPAPRHRSELALALAEREEISRGVMAGLSAGAIARTLARAPCTVSREIRRNGGRRSYRASEADEAAWHRAARPKRCKLAQNPALARVVAGKLQLEWSPYQVAGWLKRTYPQDEARHVSHETIYRTLFIQARGALRKELLQHLRRTRGMRRSRHHTQKTPDHGRITETVSIRERPAEAEDRAVPGHWEGDLIIGLDSSAIGTLVERTTRFTILLHLPRMPGRDGEVRKKNGPALAGHGAEAVREAVTRTITTLPEQLRRSLTWDQGAEMSQHAQLRIDTGVQVYFCDPHSPWQRGTNENTNGLLRQYFPKGTDLSVHSADALAAVAATLNARPRKTLVWRTPAEALDELLRSAQASVATIT